MGSVVEPHAISPQLLCDEQQRADAEQAARLTATNIKLANSPAHAQTTFSLLFIMILQSYTTLESCPRTNRLSLFTQVHFHDPVVISESFWRNEYAIAKLKINDLFATQ
jgi:hypothetical protein